MNFDEKLKKKGGREARQNVDKIEICLTSKNHIMTLNDFVNKVVDSKIT